MTAAQRHPRRRHHKQRQPVLPGHATHPAGTRATRTRRHPGTNRRARRPDRRTGPLQARPPHPRRPRRLPPRRLSRRHRQDPLPAAAIVNDTGPRQARDPHPPGAPPGLLHPADHHRAARGERETAQKHDYPSAAHRRSYARRTGAERGFATTKDPATSNISRGWCRLMGLAPLMLAVTCLLIVRNQRIHTAWNARQEQDARRAAAGLPPKTRKRLRETLASLAAPP
jgi:hypothetical protein